MAESTRILKIDAAKQYVFGWANIALRSDGKMIEDLHGDEIAPEDLEEAAYQFVLSFRDAGEQHEGEAIGALIESVVITEEKLAAMGLAKKEGAPDAGWWVAFHIENAAAFAKVASGEYAMFSIQGQALVEAT